MRRTTNDIDVATNVALVYATVVAPVIGMFASQGSEATDGPEVL